MLPFIGIRGEVLLHYLVNKAYLYLLDQLVHAKKKGSHVLNAIGLTPEEIEGAIRFSLSDLNTEEEIKEALEIIKNQ